MTCIPTATDLMIAKIVGELIWSTGIAPIAENTPRLRVERIVLACPLLQPSFLLVCHSGAIVSKLFVANIFRPLGAFRCPVFPAAALLSGFFLLSVNPALPL